MISSSTETPSLPTIMTIIRHYTFKNTLNRLIPLKFNIFCLHQGLMINFGCPQLISPMNKNNFFTDSGQKQCIRSRAVLPCEGRTGAEGGTA